MHEIWYIVEIYEIKVMKVSHTKEGDIDYL